MKLVWLFMKELWQSQWFNERINFIPASALPYTIELRSIGNRDCAVNKNPLKKIKVINGNWRSFCSHWRHDNKLNKIRNK
jgi:hypothetical protein